MNAKEPGKIYLNDKEVPLFDINGLLEGYEPIKEDDIWNEVEEE